MLRARGAGVREITRQIGRAASTVSRELRRGDCKRTYSLEYKADTAHWHGERLSRLLKALKLSTRTSRLRAGSSQRCDSGRTGPCGGAGGASIQRDGQAASRVSQMGRPVEC